MFQDNKDLSVTTAPAEVKTPKYHGLAKAICKGAIMVPQQAFGRFIRRESTKWFGLRQAGKIVAVCAMGGARLAGFNGGWGPIKRCPICRRLSYVVIHLNDYHRKSREWIADWLDSI